MPLLDFREPITHTLKLCSKYFSASQYNLKMFEIRLHDRDYRVDDLVVLQEWDYFEGDFQPSGKEVYRRISFILAAGEFEGLAPGYCALALQHR